MSLSITLVQGGGTGLDQVQSVRRVVAEAGVDVEWDEHPAGRAALEQKKDPLPEAMLKSIRSNGLALKTSLFPPADSGPEPTEGISNFNVEFRSELGLFASVRPLQNVGGLPARFENVNILVIRELTEDLYTAIEHEIVPGVVQSLKVVTEEASRRFFRFCFEWATKEGRKKAHCVHKANILKLADGLFLEAFRETAKDFPDIETHEIIVDNCCMQMVARPHQFDVMMTSNLYGDLISDLGAGIVGGTSAMSGINVGEGVRVYESFHGRTYDEVEPNTTSPLPLLLPMVDLLEGVGQKEDSQRILRAMEKVLMEKQTLTPDLGGSASTTEMTEAIVQALA